MTLSLRDFYLVKIRRLTHDKWVFQEVGLLDEHFITFPRELFLMKS